MLRSIKELGGYAILSRNNEAVGQVDDFYFDDQSWISRYLVVDTALWLPGRKVLIAPIALDRPDWNGGGSLPVELTRDQIKNSPPIDTAKPVSRQTEMELHQ